MSKDQLIDGIERINQSITLKSDIKKKNGRKDIKVALPSDNGIIVIDEIHKKKVGGVGFKTAYRMTPSAFIKKYGSTPDTVALLLSVTTAGNTSTPTHSASSSNTNVTQSDTEVNSTSNNDIRKST